MLLVRDVSGPAESVAGTPATYKAIAFNMSDPPDEELRQINWRVESAGRTVADFEARGDTLTFDVPATLVGSTIRVMPFRRSPTPVVSVLSRVVSRASINTDASNLIILSRAEWGPRTDLPRLGVIVDRTRRNRVFIHHTVVPDNDTSKNVWESLDEVKSQMRRLQTIRRDDLGADVPYTMVAFCMANGDLILCEGRGIDRLGAHTGGLNTPSLGIAFQGDFENHPPPAEINAHLVALGNWLRRLREREGFVNLGTVRPAGREVFGHRDVKSTDCPGRHIFDRLALIRYL